MGAIAGARRTQSSYPAYITSTNPADLLAPTAVVNPLIGSTTGYNAATVRALRHIPGVARVESSSGLDVLILGPHGAPVNSVFSASAGNGLGSVDGEGFDQDRVTIVSGTMADPRRADQAVMDKSIAAVAHVRAGDRVTFGVYTNTQTNLPGFGTARVKPYRTATVTITGLFADPRNVVEDDVDNNTSLTLFTPAFTRPLLACCANYTQSALRVHGGPGVVADVDAAIQRTLPKFFPAPLAYATGLAKAERAIKPESIALGVFGGIAALAALLIVAQVIGRQQRLAVVELQTLRALGSSPAMVTADGLIGFAGAIVLGALLAMGVAVLLSPLAPLGPVRPVDPTGGFSTDWTVLGLGLLALVGILGAVSLAMAYRAARPRRGVDGSVGAAAPSRIVPALARSGLPPSAVTGVRFALDPGVGRAAVPVRSTILGAALAVLVVVSTITFGMSLNMLVSHPRLYGWNWDEALIAGGGSGDIPSGTAAVLLGRDPSVGSWSGAYTYNLTIDHRTIPVLGERPGAAVQPPLLSGHGLEGADQVVLGATTLADLHEHLGQHVTLDEGNGTSKRLVIVGTATMPTVGSVGPHLEMGIGALLPSTDIPPALRNLFADPVTGPEMIFVNLRPGADATAAKRSLQRIAGSLTNNFNFGVVVSPVLHPAEIVNYRSMGTTPAILGAALATGTVVALGLTLVASVRRRRREFALLKTVGFTKGQLASVVWWQSSVVAVLGVIVGIPLGVVAGRVLWTLFAREIGAVPSPSVSPLVLVLVGVGALVLANAVASVPGRLAARTSTAVLLQAD